MELVLNYMLLFVGTISLITGIFYFLYERNHDMLNTIFYLIGLFQFLWCAGYALVGFSTSYVTAFVGRAIGFFGVLCFFEAEITTLLVINRIKKKHCIMILLPLTIIAWIDIFTYLQPECVEFIRHDNITLIQIQNSPLRIVHPIFLSLVVFLMFFFAIRWIRHSHFQRENKIMHTLMVVNTLILLGAIPDTLLPHFGYSIIPTSGFVSFIAYQFLIVSARKYNAFSISELNINSYIFDYAHSPIMVFDSNQRLAMMNQYGKDFLQIDKPRNLHISDLFELTEAEADKAFNSLSPEQLSKTLRLVTKKDHTICVVTFSTVLDSFNEPYCTVVFAYDLSKEASMLKEVNIMKSQLENALDEKRREIEQVTLSAITTIANTIDAKDAYTKGHSVRVSQYSSLLAQSLGWDDQKILNLRYTALLHDIGKIGIPDMILNKPGKLSDAEFGMIQSHTSTGGDILKDILMIPDVSAGAMYHHERYDGSGYPNGLKGENIPLVARIICIADAFDAMNSNRIYRNALNTSSIREELLAGRGTQFDPELLDKFVALFDNGELIYQNYEQTELDSANTLAEASTNLLVKIVHDIEQESSNKDNIDFLTGLMTRMSGEKKIREAMENHSGCLAFMDLDNLKHVNDTMGHAAGDVALQTFSNVMSEHAHNAIITRIGGDEFLFYMKDVNEATATEIIEGIIRSYNVRKMDDPALRTTSISAGLCMHTPADSFSEIFQKADKALYHVKQNGKSGLFVYPSDYLEAKHVSSVDLSRLVSTIHSNGHYNGALYVEYREFTKLYDFIYNLGERFGHELQFLMITLDGTDADGYTISEQEKSMTILEGAIANSLRNIDIFTRFSNTQFLLILFNSDPGSIDMIIHRIFESFTNHCPRKDLVLSYDSSDMLADTK